jgi:dolichyl-diphosphooligosaccharide--protein glycosyltransferase
MYLVGTGGGDESKRFHLAKIADVPLEKYFFEDLISGPNAFWHDTLLGKMIPFSPALYMDPNTGESYEQFYPDTVGVYVKDHKFPINPIDALNAPLQLVYTSPSFDRPDDGEMSMVLIYKVNKDYKPSFEYDILN